MLIKCIGNVIVVGWWFHVHNKEGTGQDIYTYIYEGYIQ